MFDAGLELLEGRARGNLPKGGSDDRQHGHVRGTHGPITMSAHYAVERRVTSATSDIRSALVIPASSVSENRSAIASSLAR